MPIKKYVDKKGHTRYKQDNLFITKAKYKRLKHHRS